MEAKNKNDNNNNKNDRNIKDVEHALTCVCALSAHINRGIYAIVLVTMLCFSMLLSLLLMFGIVMALYSPVYISGMFSFSSLLHCHHIIYRFDWNV